MVGSIVELPSSFPPTAPITGINTNQSTLNDVPLQTAIPCQPLTTFHLMSRLQKISDLVDPRRCPLHMFKLAQTICAQN